MNGEEAYQAASSVVLPDGHILVEDAVIRPWPSLHMSPGRSLAFTEEILRAVPGSRFWPAARVIPSEVRKLAWLTPSHAWGMAELCAVNYARGIDLVSNCPALAILICAHYVPDRDGDYWDYLSSMLGKTWRQLLAVFDLPVRPRTIRILGKLDRAHCRVTTIQKLCAELRNGNRWLGVLPHLSRITRDTVALLNTETRCLSPVLLMASEASDWDEEPVAWLIQSLHSLLAETGRCGEWPYKHVNLKQLRKAERMLRMALHPDFKAEDPLPPPPIAGIPGRIEPLRDCWSLASEGECQTNCSGGYVERVAHGKAYLYAVFYPERATLALRKHDATGLWGIEDLVSDNNGIVTDATRDFAEQWLAQAGQLPAKLKSEQTST